MIWYGYEHLVLSTYLLKVMKVFCYDWRMTVVQEQENVTTLKMN